jgi:hypothetical protein
MQSYGCIHARQHRQHTVRKTRNRMFSVNWGHNRGFASGGIGFLILCRHLHMQSKIIFWDEKWKSTKCFSLYSLYIQPCSKRSWHVVSLFIHVYAYVNTRVHLISWTAGPPSQLYIILKKKKKRKKKQLSNSVTPPTRYDQNVIEYFNPFYKQDAITDKELRMIMK